MLSLGFTFAALRISQTQAMTVLFQITGGGGECSIY
jgi:hypothetical protein